MDTHQDDLNEFERRLSAWEPQTQGLDADAMLFAAGLAAARPAAGRFVWPALAGFLAVVVVVLGGWVAKERGERLTLARQLRQPAPPPLPTVPVESPFEAEPYSFLAAHRALQQGLEAWPPQPVGRPEAGTPPAAPPAVLEAREWKSLLGP